MPLSSSASSLAPLQGVTGFVNPTPEVTPEERSGGAADPRHGNVGEVATPYPWEVFPGQTHGPYGPENQLLSAYGLGVLAAPAGDLSHDPTADYQPDTHAAPWPKGVPQSMDPTPEVLARRQESLDIHSSDLGGSRKRQFKPTDEPVNDEWQGFFDVSAGESGQLPIPSQIMTGGAGGFGSRDRVQSMARQNQYGYDMRHHRRRWASGPIPGNILWMQPGGRPLVRTMRGTALVPVGQDSPFAGQVTGDAFTTSGAALYDLPTEYVAPPTPTVTPAPAQSAPVPVIALW